MSNTFGHLITSLFLLLLAAGCSSSGKKSGPPPVSMIDGPAKALDALREGKLKRAGALFREELERARTEDELDAVATASTGLGFIRYLENNVSEADRYLAASDAILRDLGKSRARVWLLRAKVARKADNHAKANTFLENVLNTTASQAENAAEAFLIRFEMARDRGDIPAARVAAEQLGNLVNQTSAASLKPDWILAKAQLAEVANAPSAPTDFDAAMEAFRTEKRWRDLAIAQFQLGRVLAGQGDAETAARHFARAAESFISLNERAAAVEALDGATRQAEKVQDPVLAAWIASLVVETDPEQLRWKE